MPAYPWLFEKETDYDALPSKIRAMRMLGVPYPIDLSEEEIQAQIDEQADAIVARLAEQSAYTEPDKEIVALIAYLQKLGTFEIVGEAEEEPALAATTDSD